MKHKIWAKERSPSLLASALLMGFGPAANALGPIDVPPTWGGDLSSRQRLTGDWGGVRDELGQKGVLLDANMTLLPGGIVTGGKDSRRRILGKRRLHAEYRYRQTGALAGRLLQV